MNICFILEAITHDIMKVSRRKFLDLGIKSAFLIRAGNSIQALGADRHFSKNNSQTILRFAIASDGHYGQPDVKYEQFHTEMINWLNIEKDQNSLDFTFINGDLVHDEPKWAPELKGHFNELKTPWYVSRGNHDKMDSVAWEKAWDMPLNYSFIKNNSAFLVLDTANEKGEYICSDVEWTAKELKKLSSFKQLFVFMHITPFSWTANGKPCPQIVELFDKQANLKAVFHGHDHDQDGFKEHNGKYYFFDSHIAGNWGTSYRGYRIVEVSDAGEIITYQVNPAEKKTVNTSRI
ncbi:MAG TPA: transcriptional regulator [Sphingobacteriaceae bacterium]|nr:transcriptional regulator [Sphingobacteriaceae bacterium]